MCIHRMSDYAYMNIYRVSKQKNDIASTISIQCRKDYRYFSIRQKLVLI
jgi:hypothetical protein